MQPRLHVRHTVIPSWFYTRAINYDASADGLALRAGGSEVVRVSQRETNAIHRVVCRTPPLEFAPHWVVK